MTTEPAQPPSLNPGGVVVGVDGSVASQTALLWAANYAEKFDVGLEAVLSYQLGSLHGYPIPDVDDDGKNKAIKELHDSIVATLGEDSGTVETVVRRPAPLALLKAAKNAALLVLGTRGRGAFSGMLLGSVSQHCVQHAPCPVVVVPPAPED